MSVLESQEIAPVTWEYEAPQFLVLGELADLAIGQGEDGQLTMQFSSPFVDGE